MSHNPNDFSTKVTDAVGIIIVMIVLTFIAISVLGSGEATPSSPSDQEAYSEMQYYQNVVR
jgi:hypothetical protein